MLHFDPTFYGDGNAMYSGVACWRRPGTHWAVDRESNGASEGDASFIAPCKLGAARPLSSSREALGVYGPMRVGLQLAIRLNTSVIIFPTP